MRFAHHFLRERFLTVDDRYIHHNPDVVPLLLKLKPDVVITDGFNPTHLYALLVACTHGWAHVAMADGTWQSEHDVWGEFALREHPRAAVPTHRMHPVNPAKKLK